MEVVALQSSDCELLSARYAEHGNSFRRMTAALREAGAHATVERLRALRRIEGSFDLDLGMVCHWYASRDRDTTHPVARAIIHYIVQQPASASGEIWIMLDRVRQLRTAIEEGRLVGEPEL